MVKIGRAAWNWSHAEHEICGF